MQKALGISPESTASSARRTQKPDEKKPPPKDKAPAAPSTFPPDNFNWNAMLEYYKTHKNACPGCYQRNNQLHRKIGCLALAKCGFVCKFDPVGSKKVQEEHVKAQKAKADGKASAKRAGDDKAEEDDKNKDDASQASAKRSTAQRSQTKDPGYYDPFLEMDSDEDRAPMDDRLKNNDNSAPYLCNTSNSAAKFKVVASARHVSTSLAAAAHLALQSSPTKVSPVNHSHQECCADSGATEHMFNDYKAFVSYRRCHNEFVTLGDETQLKIYGRGTARFLLNDKLIEVRDALHVPDLRNPLYSLRRHRHMSGCGYYSQYGVGSFILFPAFTIEVDDSSDNLVSFQAVGRSTNRKLDYREPKQTACPVHIVPPDEDDAADLELIKINIPDPKARPLPTPASPEPVDVPITPPPPSPEEVPQDDSIVISDSDFVASAQQPLTKRMLAHIHDDPSSLPEVPPEYTPGPTENTTTFDQLRLHRIFGCRRFKNQNHITAASKNAELIKCGEMPSTIGDFVTINNPNKGKPLTKHRKFLDKCHMDIVYGDCLSLGG
jgi:hypothetical protein